MSNILDQDRFGLVTPKELAEILGINLQCVYRAVKDGRIKSVRMGRRVRIHMKEVELLYENGFESEK